MSDIDTGTIGATAPGHYGAAATGATLAEVTLAAAWNVQGDPARADFLAEVLRIFGVKLPQVPNTTARGIAWTALWLGPRSWLLAAHGDPQLTPALADYLSHRDALNAVGGALFALSASRVAYKVAGADAAAVLAKSCPLDFHPSAFPAGTCAQSVVGHTNALIDRPDASAAFIVMVARSLARDVWRALCLSAAQYGYEVAPPSAYD